MSEYLKIGRRVEVTGKGVQGVIAFIGKTSFAVGSWIGLVLDEPVGKNNGSVKGHEYFKCEEKYGMFVRESQVVPLDENGKPIENWNDSPPSKIARSRQSSSRMSLASSRQSLAGSRQSLAGSRQSLTGSRNHLASPSSEKPAEGGESSSQIPKRASFVETGFVETLKPQFTLGHAMTTTPTPITSVDEKLSQLQLQQELENRSQLIRDLGEKLETLKLKRQDDKEKLKDYDKLKIQLEQLVEFKSKIMSTQASLQRDIQKAKQEAKEAIEAKEAHEEEVADLAEAVEMATLDKEMAEEKAETLQLELEFCKEKLEEVTLDLEILKTEMQERTSATGTSSGEDQPSAYEIKQLQQQNARLRETLVRLRDLSAHEKHEYQKLMKDIDQKKSEITELGKTKEKLSARVEEMEQQIADLQEQVDAALGAEEMVVILSDQKLTLEEKVVQLMEEVSELEALQDMNDQLVESNAELEADLREELDMALAATREAMRDRDAAMETIADREQTIGKFRSLVHQLQEQSLDLQHRLEKETSKPVSALPEIIDFKKMFSETKAHTKAIDLELRRIDIQQLQQHIKYLSSFMPDSFMSRGDSYLKEFKIAALLRVRVQEAIIHHYQQFIFLGGYEADMERDLPSQTTVRHIANPHFLKFNKFLSAFGRKLIDETLVAADHDAVLITLLIPRMIQKTEILASQIKDKFPTMEKVDRAAIIKSHSVEQYAFRCRISFYIFALQTILRQYYYALNKCQPEILLKVGAAYPEMAGHEKIIDGYVELIKRDQLDENAPTEALEKCVTYFNSLFPVLLGTTVEYNQTQLLSDNVKCLSAIVDGFTVDSLILRSLMETSNIGDIALLAQHIITTADLLQQQLKLVKRRLPPDASISNLGLSKETVENLYQCYQHAGKIIKTLHDIVKTTIQTLLSEGAMENGISPEKLKDVALSSSDKVYEQDDLGPVQSIKQSLNYLLTEVSKIAQFLLDNEYEISTASSDIDEKQVPPIQIRAETVKKELEQTKTLTSKLENKESDIKELRRLLKEKQEQLSEMTIRKELAEKKLGNVNKDYELTIEKLQRKSDEASNFYKKREKEFEETLDHLQSDIDSLENEKGDLKEKLKMYSKKAALEVSLSKSISGSQMPSLQSLGPNLPAVVKDSPLLMQEIDNLRKLFHQERNERIRLQNDNLKEQLDSMKPLPSFKHTRDEVLENLYKEGAALKQEILMALAKPTFPQIYKTKQGNGPAAWQRHFIEEQNRIFDLKRRAEHFQSIVAAEAVKRKDGGRIESDLRIFPTKEMAKALNEDKPINIGFVKIPKAFLPSYEKSKIVNLELDFENLQKILHTLMNE